MKRRRDTEGEYADWPWWDRPNCYPRGLCCIRHHDDRDARACSDTTEPPEDRPEKWRALVAARKAAAPRGWTLWSVRQLTKDTNRRTP